ncbi:MAG: hypothetical protein DSM107014_15820 [Gomphosphaeria aponina SAG 52.96 = DSM 107014]|uniref:Uncharacterized protein n=1 Tax=Gomphosphaeria aponina SAG 52.96 = DSM 107014 TaxID=1521640 RepID=A0A941GTN3_9CHRO|nr:hypothetical protein [Gomphosphaeria aponina SAG 52.96 = DSM 107014]
MKLNPTLGLTFLLLILMLVAGAVSTWWGYMLGYEALKSVTQPDVNPAQQLAEDEENDDQQEGFTIVDEQEILVKVKGYIQGASSDKSATEENENQARKDIFPLAIQDNGVTLQVVKTSNDGESLLLNVSLKNEGEEPVEFLYSLLEIKDENSRTLSGITDGLPPELPANGESFSGTIRIPLALLNDAKQISLTLPDYPQQQVKLKIAAIPVVR